MKKVVHIILGKANPNRMSGVNRVVYNICSAQAEYEMEVELWGISSSQEHNYGERNFKTFLFPKSKRIFGLDKSVYDRIDKENEKTIFHLHGGWLPTNYSLGLYLNKKGFRFVLTPHGAYNIVAMKRSFLVKKIYFILFERKLIKASFSLHAVGKSELVGMKKLVPSKNRVLIPYGFPLPDKEYPLPPLGENMIIGFVGRLDIETKGLDIIIKALNLCKEKDINFEFWIIGGGKEEYLLRQLVSDFELNHQVKFFGPRFGEEKLDFISKMDLFIHASRNEGLPSAILEAASIGCPMLVTEATNLGHYLKDCNGGWVVENENPNTFFSTILNIYSIWKNKELSSYGTRARDMVKKHFNWSNIIHRLNEMYHYEGH